MIFVGQKLFAGWRFSLTEQRHANGAPGYARRTLVPCPAIQEGLRRSAAECARLHPERAAAYIAEANAPTADWVEEQWPIEWLRHGLIRAVKPGE